MPASVVPGAQWLRAGSIHRAKWEGERERKTERRGRERGSFLSWRSGSRLVFTREPCLQGHASNNQMRVEPRSARFARTCVGLGEDSREQD